MPLFAVLFCALAAEGPPKLPTHDEGAPAEVHAAASAWLVETAEGLVVIDPPASTAELKTLRARIDSLHKPLAAVLLTHAPADGGESIPSLGVRFEVAALEGARAALSLPEVRVVEPNQPVVYGGAHFVVHDLGKGATKSDAVWVLLGRPRAAFVGALVREGEKAPPDPAARLEQLERARRLLYGLRVLYPGSGGQGTFALLERQRKLLAGDMLPPK